MCVLNINVWKYVMWNVCVININVYVICVLMCNVILIMCVYGNSNSNDNV